MNPQDTVNKSTASEALGCRVGRKSPWVKGPLFQKNCGIRTVQRTGDGTWSEETKVKGLIFHCASFYCPNPKPRQAIMRLCLSHIFFLPQLPWGKPKSFLPDVSHPAALVLVKRQKVWGLGVTHHKRQFDALEEDAVWLPGCLWELTTICISRQRGSGSL